MHYLDGMPWYSCVVVLTTWTVVGIIICSRIITWFEGQS